MSGKQRATYRCVILCLVMCFALLIGCSSGSHADRVLGRWQRIAEALFDHPMALIAEYLEFRPDGLLLPFLYDAPADTYWTLREDHYILLSGNRIEFQGNC